MRGDTWWMWTVMLAATAGFWVIVALAVQALLTDRRTAAPPPSPATGTTPRELLNTRLARGDIDPDEYVQLRQLLDRPLTRPPQR